MLAPWPEEDLLPVSSPKPHNCWNSLHFFCWEKKKKRQVPVSHKLLPSLFYTQSQTSPHMNWALCSLQSNCHFRSQMVMNYTIWVANPWELNIFSSCHDSEGIAPSFEKMLILQKAGSRQHSGHLYFSFLFYYHERNFIALCSPGSIWCSPRPHTVPHQPQCIASTKNGRPKTAQNNTFAQIVFSLCLSLFLCCCCFFFSRGCPKSFTSGYAPNTFCQFMKRW